jgi:hypothetical protein
LNPRVRYRAEGKSANLNHIVLERVGAHDIIVVGICGAPDEARSPVFRARDRLELHRDRRGERRRAKHSIDRAFSLL